MIPGAAPIHVAGRFWRMLAPRWSHQPLSGEGAARHGGRYNAPGTPALYMSEAFTMAVAEYEQDLGIRPGMLCAYDVEAGGILDLTDPATLAALGTTPADLAAPWKQIALIERGRPPTWDLAGRLIEAGAIGVRVPSTRAAGANLVLWRWNTALGARVAALDPLGDLPRSPRSWEP
ncbi:RES family NAD+ phosphorylase [Salinarimonas soli]|uniref:RES domain-containing protein n=1 Tax=Salinarimonas soli TaxID=1638099 RepID=A0A5B2VBR4_9HYPH|nr:RES domain-containing protein [Salinarimonas soli]KAA2235739.1 RES domain-containing protein [Salinarimonas soli]